METKFTKGEWGAVIYYLQCFIYSDGDLIADLDHSDVPYQETEANAHLMATSPKMYRMLEKLCRTFEMGEELESEIEALLAEARGEHENNT